MPKSDKCNAVRCKHSGIIIWYFRLFYVTPLYIWIGGKVFHSCGCCIHCMLVFTISPIRNETESVIPTCIKTLLKTHKKWYLSLDFLQKHWIRGILPLVFALNDFNQQIGHFFSLVSVISIHASWPYWTVFENGIKILAIATLIFLYG